jgi:hypothetical protein
LHVIHLLLAVEGGETPPVFLAFFACQAPGEGWVRQRVAVTVHLIAEEEEALVA